MNPVLMKLNDDDIDHSTTHRTALLQVSISLTWQCAKHEKFPCTLKDETGFVEETRGGELLSSSSFILIVF